MVASDTFIFLHPPKTGGTFVTEILTDVYVNRLKRPLYYYDKHGGVAGIPAEHHFKALVTTIRNPFDYYASNYQFGYWIERDWDDVEGGRPAVPATPCFWNDELMRHQFPNYPYISFEEYLEGAFHLGRRSLPADKQVLADKLCLGPASVSALFYSVPEYIALLDQLLVDRDISRLKHQIARTRFLHTESLNRDTYRWLLDLNVPAELAELALTKRPVKPINTPNSKVLLKGHGQARDTHWSVLFNEHSKAQVFKFDWLFFELFPEYSWAVPAHTQNASLGAGI